MQNRADYAYVSKSVKNIKLVKKEESIVLCYTPNERLKIKLKNYFQRRSYHWSMYFYKKKYWEWL